MRGFHSKIKKKTFERFAYFQIDGSIPTTKFDRFEKFEPQNYPNLLYWNHNLKNVLINCQNLRFSAIF